MRVFLKKLRNERVFTLLGILIIVFSLSNPEFFPLNFGNEKKGNLTTVENKNLKSSIVSERIVIANNWSAANATGICTGSGSFSDPYVIKDLIIDGGGEGTGISIRSRNDYFKIENCTIFNCLYGIRLLSTNNGTLYNNNCSYNGYGIYLDTASPFIEENYGCLSNTIKENIVNNNGDGIYLKWCHDTKIIGNIANNNNQWGIYFGGGLFNPDVYQVNLLGRQNTTFKENIANQNTIGIYIEGQGNHSIISENIAKGNKDYGILLESNSWILKENTMSGSGLGFSEGDINDMSQYDIDINNTVNEGPIYYYANKTNLSPNDFLNAGQIILVNCTSVFIKDLNVSYSSKGFTVYHSDKIEILNCSSSNNRQGITLWNTSNSILEGCTTNNNVYGIESIIGSENNSIIGNHINNNMFGTWVSGNNNIVKENYINNNTMGGLKMFLCENNKIIDNHIKENNKWGIYLVGSYNIINGNVICRNNYTSTFGIKTSGGSENNTFYLNFFKENWKHVEDNGIENKWNNSQIGNYWDNYTGMDANGDGIGDTPHKISLSPLIQDFLPIVDNDPPEITIISPSNNSVFGSTAPSFEIEVNEKYLDIMWYTLDSGLYNYTFIENGTIDQTMWGLLPSGQVKLRFYAIDKAGNIAFEEVLIIKQKKAAIPGYDPLLLLGITILFCFTLIKIVRYNGKKIRKIIG